MARLGAMLLDNIQVDIGRVHLRFEDALSNPRSPFAFGVTMGGMSLYSTDADWEAGFVHDTKGIVYKAVFFFCSFFSVVVPV